MITSLSRLARRKWQAISTSLPLRHAPFAELFPPVAVAESGALHASAGYSGILSHEKGSSYFVSPTCFSDGVPGELAGEDRGYLTREPDRTLYALTDGVLIGSNGICYEPRSRTVVSETLDSWEASPDTHMIFSTPGFPPARKLPGRTLSLAGLGGETFYHFLLEALPKLALARAIWPQIDQIAIPRYMEQSKERWLRALGFEKKIIWLQDLDHLQCDQLIFTGRLARHFEPNPWCVRTLREFAHVPDHHPRSRRVWLDRSGTANRAVDWERGFASELHGFESLDLGQIPPEKTISVCRETQVYAGLHGAAFANMVFTPPGALILELMTKPFHPFYSRLAGACGHRHCAIRIGSSNTERAAAAATITSLAGKFS